MHEIRSLMENGGHRDVIFKKDGAQPKTAGLAQIAIARQEARKTNQRREDRHVNLADSATITFRRKRIEVGVVNVSPHGVMIESDIEPRVGERVEIRFEDCNRTLCCVRWIRGGQIGLEFASETVLIASAEVRDLIVSGRRAGEQPPRLEIRPERPPRQKLVWKAVLHHGVESGEAYLRNISTNGAMLDCGEDLLVGTAVVLEVTGTGANPEGRVRWCRSGQIGVLFDQPFDMRVLAEVKPAPKPKDEIRRYVRPDYLASEGSPDSPWAARTCGLRPEDL